VTEVEAGEVVFVGGKRASDEGVPYDPQTAPDSSPSSFSGDEDFGKSIHEKGFSDDFPMDFAEMEKDTNKNSESDIPF